jgi:hypothetical protein
MVDYTMGGEHGGNNDNNMTFQDVADVEDHVWFEDRWMVASLCDE